MLQKGPMPLQMHGMNSRPLGLSTSQAARELGVSLGTVRRWSDMGYLQSYRTPGGQRRFSVEHIEQFVRSLQQTSYVVREQRDSSLLQRATG
jgi:excisionase family DNA binding protein